jgi:hypothetical protein
MPLFSGHYDADDAAISTPADAFSRRRFSAARHYAEPVAERHYYCRYCHYAAYAMLSCCLWRSMREALKVFSLATAAMPPLRRFATITLMPLSAMLMTIFSRCRHFH